MKPPTMIPAVMPAAWRIWFGTFPIYVNGKPLGKGSVDIIKRGQLQCNVHVHLYRVGKYPFFREKDKTDAATLRLPLSLIPQMSQVLKDNNLRVRVQKDHRWKMEFYDMTDAMRQKKRSQLFTQFKTARQEGEAALEGGDLSLAISKLNEYETLLRSHFNSSKNQALAAKLRADIQVQIQRRRGGV